jgi:hypothetical protein
MSAVAGRVPSEPVMIAGNVLFETRPNGAKPSAAGAATNWTKRGDEVYK